MKPTTVIYWTRAGLGVVAALLSSLLGLLAGDINLLNGLSIALLLYIVTYYIYKALYVAQVEKPSKIFSTGVGAYFLTWIVVLGIFFTFTSPVLAITSPNPNAVFVPGDSLTITARIANQFGSPFSGANVTVRSPTNALIQLTENSPGIYTATYNVTSSDPIGDFAILVKATINSKYREAAVSVRIQSGS